MRACRDLLESLQGSHDGALGRVAVLGIQVALLDGDQVFVVVGVANVDDDRVGVAAVVR